MKAYDVYGFNLVSGRAKEFQIDHRIFNAAVFCSAVIALVHLIRSFFDPLISAVQVLIPAIVFFIFVAIFYLSRIKQQRSTSLRLVYLFLTFSGLMFAWFTTGGITGITPYYFLLTFMIYLTIFKMRYHIIISLLTFTIVTILGVYQYNFPLAFGGDIVPNQTHIENLIFAAMVTLFFSLGMINYLKLNYSLEKRKVMRANVELVASEKRAQVAKNEALDASKVKAEFLSTMSHEIRTPMNAVIGMTHLLIQDNPSKEQLENLNVLKFSAENLLALINDILDFSKIEAGKIVFEKVEFSITDLVNSVKNALAIKAADKGIEINVKLADKIPKTVIADPTRLTQILNNLVGNAVKFTKEGSVTIDISLIELNKQQATISFSVIDTGIGIPKDQQSKIFDMFSQASSSTTREFGGTGLGLSITKHLLELQGSEIVLDSTPGVGTTFTFKLNFEVCEKKTKSSKVNFDKELFSSLNGLKVLIADDNKTNIFIANKFLHKWDINSTAVCNGQEALECVQHQDFDLVLMDLQMPVMDGAEATRRIRNLDDHFKACIPIIALTASAMLEDQESMMNSGMNDFVSKPFNPGDLYQKIVHYTSQRTKAA